MENLQREITKLDTMVARQIFAIDIDHRIEILDCSKNMIEVVFDTGETHILPYNEYFTETIEFLIRNLK